LGYFFNEKILDIVKQYKLIKDATDIQRIHQSYTAGIGQTSEK
jgi:hypothetical protein